MQDAVHEHRLVTHPVTDLHRANLHHNLAGQQVPPNVFSQLLRWHDPFMAEHSSSLVTRVSTWFSSNARELPWRSDPTPWGVLVSEVMLQQTPVARVLPVWQSWMTRWPNPTQLAMSPLADALRAWGRLGYPRRAMRLHESARMISAEFNGEVPASYNQLRSLPGVGDYTAAAVLSFAFGESALVLDVNVRRFLVRHQWGVPAVPGAVTGAERQLAESLLPTHGAPLWAAASMELGQLVCTARTPNCESCPVAADCTWLAAGKPGADQRTTRRQTYEGTDRQVRGLILRRLHNGPASQSDLSQLWADRPQLDRALDSLVADGLVDPISPQTYALPEDSPAG
jgi:A/G-specific adenine glycosylase